MSDELVARFLEQALDRRARGLEVNLEQICAERPELLAEVERLLRIDEVIDYEPPDDALVGAVLAERYELRACIGVGAMGTVYVAQDRTLGREVAVKLLQNAVFASPERHERFAREAQVLAALRHPNIVGVYDHGRSADGQHFIVMERLVGVPLSEVLQQAENDGRLHGRRLDDAWLQQQFDGDARGVGYLPQVVQWCAQVADALREAHAAGVTHRDVKPTNVFIDESGAAILLDFGIAARAGDGSLTAQGSTIGSPWYMAPEQVAAKGPVSDRVDVYGLCATLYHLATLRPPFEGDYSAVLTQLATREPVPPRFARPELSQDLCAVIEKGMERDPARRYASMAELGDDLLALAEQLPVQARPITRFGRWLRSVRRRPGPYLAAAALAVAVGVTIPVVSSYRDAQYALRGEQHEQHLAIVARLAPSMALEAAFEMRPKLDPVERQGYIDQLTHALALREDDQFVRLLRSALLLDRGDVADSLEDIRWFARRAPSPFLDAFVARYEQIDPAKPGVLGLDLNGLPEPASEVDRVVLGFQLYRLRRDPQVVELLGDDDGVAARSIRVGPMCGLAAWRYRSDQTARDGLYDVLLELEQLEGLLGGVTARTLYWRGQALVALRDWNAAAAALESSRQLCGKAYGTLYNLGIALGRLGRRREALELTRAAHALRPANVNAVEQIAVLLAELEEFETAQREADAVPEGGHTSQPWRRDLLLGFVAHRRSIHAYGERRPEDAERYREAAMERYRAAMQHAEPGSRVARVIRTNVAQLDFHDLEPRARVQRLLEQLGDDPDSRVHLIALATALEQTDLFPSQELRKQFQAFLLERARLILASDPK